MDISLLHKKKSRTSLKVEEKFKMAKNGLVLFSRLFISCESHENQSFPPSLSEKDNLRPAKSKSDVIDSILKTPHGEISKCHPVEVKIFDGPALVNMLLPSNCKTFLDYSCEVFVPFLESQSRLVARVNLVWDRYFDDSIKGATRNNRGVGICQKVTSNGFLPKKFSFLRCSENKAELFPFLSENIVSAVSSETLCIATTDENVIANQDVNLSCLMPCTLEEADERMFLHALHASENYKSMLIKTVDNDIVTIAISVFQNLPMLNELWIEFGTGKSLKFIPFHEIAAKMGKVTSQALLVFHALSRCDTTSSLSGKGKKLFFENWKLLPDISTTFPKLGTYPAPSEIHDQYYKIVEKYFIALYSPRCNTEKVSEARRILFASGGRSIENTVCRAALQVSL